MSVSLTCSVYFYVSRVFRMINGRMTEQSELKGVTRVSLSSVAVMELNITVNKLQAQTQGDMNNM